MQSRLSDHVFWCAQVGFGKDFGASRSIDNTANTDPCRLLTNFLEEAVKQAGNPLRIHSRSLVHCLWFSLWLCRLCWLLPSCASAVVAPTPSSADCLDFSVYLEVLGLIVHLHWPCGILRAALSGQADRICRRYRRGGRSTTSLWTLWHHW